MILKILVKASEKLEKLSLSIILIARFGFILLIICSLIFGLLLENNINMPFKGYVFIVYYFYVIMFGCIISGVLQKISFICKVFVCYFNKDKQIIESSIHEAAHALTRELFFQKSNKISIIKKNIFSCYKFVKENKKGTNEYRFIYGISIHDPVLTEIYYQSAKNNDEKEKFLSCFIQVVMAGYMAEAIFLDNESKINFFERNDLVNHSDYVLAIRTLELLSQTLQINIHDLKDIYTYKTKQLLLENKDALLDIYYYINFNGFISGKQISRIVKSKCKYILKHRMKYKKIVFLKVKIYVLLSKIDSIKLLLDTLGDVKYYFKDALREFKNEFKGY